MHPAPTPTLAPLLTPHSLLIMLFFACSCNGGTSAATEPYRGSGVASTPTPGTETTPGPTTATATPTPTVTPTPTPTGASLVIPAPDYNSSLPPWPTTFSGTEVQAQQTNGNTLLQGIAAAISASQPNYVIAPGVYRISQSIVVANTNNFTLQAAGAEIITEGTISHFRILSNSNFALVGPVILDGNQFGFTQGTIAATDGQTYIDVGIMAGYPPPNPQGRMMFYAPDGTSLRHFEDPAVGMSNTGGNVWRISVSNGTFNLYAALTQNVIVPGNYMVIDSAAGFNGGFEMRNNVNVTMTDVNVHTSCLTWGLPELGNDVFERFHGTRRLGTNRLGAGGWMQIGYYGGSFTLLDSELAYNLDDLTDVGGTMGYVWQQATATSAYGGLDAGVVGQTLVFTDYNTLQPAGSAVLTAINPVTDNNLISAYEANLSALNILNDDSLVELVFDRTVSINFSIIDVTQGRPTTMTVKNSWLHDGLAAGVSLKGANLTTVQNTVVQRTGYRGIGVNIDPYWWEGGIPHTAVITNNTVNDVPYNLPPGGGAIDVSLQQTAAGALGTPIGSVTIAYNLVTNPQAEGINVGNANGVQVLHNRVQNPVSQRQDNGNGGDVAYVEAAAIGLDVVGPGTVVRDNVATQVDSAAVPMMIWVSARTDVANITDTNNTMSP